MNSWIVSENDSDSESREGSMTPNYQSPSTPAPDITLPSRLQLYSRRLSQLGLETNNSDELITTSNTITSEDKYHSLNKKCLIKFQAIGNVPPIRPAVCRISASQPFAVITGFLRRRLHVDSVYCYLNNSFAPSPDQLVGQLFDEFHTKDELIVSYCGSVAFG